MKLGHIELFVTDPLKSKEFYQGVLGCEVVAVQHGPFVWLKLGETEILLRPGKGAPRAAEYRHAPAGLVLYTDDMGATVQRLKERGLAFWGTDSPDGCLTFTDPDGHWFQLVDPNDPPQQAA
jgi:catechol 2,3-dioxygenase-like lactoylglutathione lyase family enzyme